LVAWLQRALRGGYPLAVLLILVRPILIDELLVHGRAPFGG
jgi:hypothetical protein